MGKDLSRLVCNGNICDSVKCVLLIFICVLLLSNVYNFLKEINIYKWFGFFLGYCLCGVIERRRKANFFWFSL